MKHTLTISYYIDDVFIDEDGIATREDFPQYLYDILHDEITTGEFTCALLDGKLLADKSGFKPDFNADINPAHGRFLRDEEMKNLKDVILNYIASEDS